ncbi:MAG TPA: class I SAM-dependent methyltransferase [Bryobacteraceae bacterium]|jgi:SAM-dependent methyltransferase|nr:class I SAM-dependent methyltransferase [Bryobacteraceae bacterium]
MRAEWNARAREDAHYYVAFGRRDQDDGEFLDSAADVIRDLEGELKRLPSNMPVAERRALEVGCGPGRLMRPISRHFGEIHGVDVSDEMIAQSRIKLSGIPHAHTHHASGSDLAMFPPDYFDFVYSYAVFQHIPSAEVVFSYFQEIARVLKPLGVARLQVNGLPDAARTFTTWDGVRISGRKVHAWTREHGIELLSLTGVDTQYMWTTWRKPRPCRIRSIVSAFSGENAVPSSSMLSCIAIWMEDMPEACELNSLEAFIDGVPGRGSYIGQSYGLSQFNVFLPRRVRTGLVPVRIEWNGRRLCPDGTIRVIPAGPVIPKLVSISDGVNLLSYQRVSSGSMKATVEEVPNMGDFAVSIDGTTIQHQEPFQTDPLSQRYEVNIELPETIAAGGHVLQIRVGQRTLAKMGIEVVR